MPNIKADLGKKIGGYREAKKLSREAFCGDELELTVRQLARIESGQSLPTLPKLRFISDGLQVPISQLIDEEYVELPRQYIQLKNRLYRAAMYNEEMEKVVEQLFTTIYEEYYQYLPEEEQLAIDVYQATADVHLTENINFEGGILREYFDQILKHERAYTENELLILNLYFHYASYTKVDREEFDFVLRKVIEQVELLDMVNVFLLCKMTITGMHCLIVCGEYEKLLTVIRIANILMKQNGDFYKKPIVDMIEGKYWLSVDDTEMAHKKYGEAIQLATLHGDNVLAEKITIEYKQDLEIFAEK